MSFYKTISDYYRDIFPLQPAQPAFVNEAFTDPANTTLLDVGCGPGDLSLELSSGFKHITGIDLDPVLLEIARSSARENVDFLTLDMLQMKKAFGSKKLDGVLCFGNTLVHLSNPEQISGFLYEAASILNPNGKLLLQLINYDRILDQGIKALPTIETDLCTFVRKYTYDSSRHVVNFETILTIKDRGEKIQNSIPLYPLRQRELQSMLEIAGFSTISFFGSFKRATLEEDSIPLVVEASF